MSRGGRAARGQREGPTRTHATRRRRGGRQAGRAWREAGGGEAFFSSQPKRSPSLAASLLLLPAQWGRGSLLLLLLFQRRPHSLTYAHTQQQQQAVPAPSPSPSPSIVQTGSVSDRSLSFSPLTPLPCLPAVPLPYCFTWDFSRAHKHTLSHTPLKTPTRWIYIGDSSIFLEPRSQP